MSKMPFAAGEHFQELQNVPSFGTKVALSPVPETSLRWNSTCRVELTDRSDIEETSSDVSGLLEIKNDTKLWTGEEVHDFCR